MKLYKLFALASAAAVTLSMAGCSDRSEKYQDYEPGNRRVELNPVMETEKGYYARRTNLIENMLEICYYDKESGKAIYLCSKPECSHDGGKFCTATDSDIKPDYITMSDGYVYISGTEYSDEEDTLKWKLYRASADGTEFTEVCTFQTVKSLNSPDRKINSSVFASYDNGTGSSIASAIYWHDLIVHKGYAIVPFYDYENPSLMYKCMPNTMIIDLESGQYKRLPTSDYDVTKIQNGQLGLYTEDNYLYYYVEPQGYINTKHLYRYDLVTGETERIGTNTRLSDFVVMDSVIYYTTVPTDEQEYVPFYAYDTATGEEKDMSEKLTSIYSRKYLRPQFICDGTYIYFSTEFYNDKWEKTFFMMTEDTEPLTHIETPKEMQDYYTELKISNGKAYFVGEISFSNGKAAEKFEEVIWVTSSIAYSCPVEDIAAGNPEWTLAYDFTEFEESLIEDIKDETE